MHTGSLEISDEVLQKIIKLAGRNKNITIDNTPYLEQVLLNLCQYDFFIFNI